MWIKCINMHPLPPDLAGFTLKERIDTLCLNF